MNAFKSFFDNVPFRGVNHQGHAADIRLTRDQIDEVNHRLFGVEHALVHIDIDDLRAALDLVTGNIERFGIGFSFNQAQEFL